MKENLPFSPQSHVHLFFKGRLSLGNPERVRDSSTEVLWPLWGPTRASRPLLWGFKLNGSDSCTFYDSVVTSLMKWQAGLCIHSLTPLHR